MALPSDRAVAATPSSPAVSPLRASIPSADVERFHGEFMVFRLRAGKGLHKRIGGSFMPSYKHTTLDSAEVEATRLNAMYPHSTFVIMQAVSRVKAAHE